METAVGKRAFLCIGGYEPIGVEWWHQRFQRELKRFETTWNVQAAITPPVLSEDGAIASWRIEASGADWQVGTEYRLLRWEDFVTADFARPDFERVPKGIGTLLDFIVSGAAFRYFRTSVRYGFFFLYPLVILAAVAAAAFYAPRLLPLFGVSVAGGIAAAISIVVFLGLLYLAGRKLLLNYMFDDWIFARQFIRRARPGLDGRLDRFAREIVACSRDTSFDEVVISAHSLGGALIIDALDRALKFDPQFGQHGPKVWLMATGSSLLKVALHPKAKWLREASARVAGAAGLRWIEYQAVVDVISFYDVNPLEEMGFGKRSNPEVQKVRMRKMLAPATYRRFKGNFFRLHRQWSMGNELRYFYDYYQIISGPVPLARRVEARERLLDAFSADGGYNAGPLPAPMKKAAQP